MRKGSWLHESRTWEEGLVCQCRDEPADEKRRAFRSLLGHLNDGAFNAVFAARGPVGLSQHCQGGVERGAGGGEGQGRCLERLNSFLKVS